jgi:hypothetical protein
MAGEDRGNVRSRVTQAIEPVAVQYRILCRGDPTWSPVREGGHTGPPLHGEFVQT